MVCDRNGAEGAGYGKVRKSDYICQKLVYGSICLKLQAENAETRWGCIISHSLTVYSGGSEPDSP